MSLPRLLDLFCGAGGCARGYQMAGFYVVGVDIKPQPHYAGDEFVQADAMTYPLDGFDVIHASPPCQSYSPLNARWGYAHTVDLVGPIRERMDRSGLPYVIENVLQAPLDRCITLCGSMFGLKVLRHRRFESNFLLFAPGPCQHRGTVQDGPYVTVTGFGSYGHVRGRGLSIHPIYSEAMGIDWMTRAELNQAIPPAYTKWIGRQLMGALERGAVGA